MGPVVGIPKNHGQEGRRGEKGKKKYQKTLGRGKCSRVFNGGFDPPDGEKPLSEKRKGGRDGERV